MKVTIVGPGTVGMVIAYTLMLRGAAREIVLIGANREKAEGEAMDLMHAQAFLDVPVRIRAGDLSQCTDSEIVCVCASVPPPERLTDRNVLAAGNKRLMREILPTIATAAPAAKLLMVSNPVDVLTWHALELTGFPPERVMGTGTLVDSIRFREMLSELTGVHPHDLRAYILGEHGDHQFAAMSVAQAGGEKIEDTPERRTLCRRAAEAGIEVFRKKHNTCYAIGQAAAYVIDSILLDEKRTMPLSVRIDGFLGVTGVCLSLPVVVGKRGIERVFHPALDEHEARAFCEAAAAVRRVIDS
ncbi:MAG: malate dehydrogenase [Verrucomicrobiales bacterium]